MEVPRYRRLMKIALNPGLTRDETHVSFYPRARRQDGDVIWHECDNVVPERETALEIAFTVAAPEILGAAGESVK